MKSVSVVFCVALGLFSCSTAKHSLKNKAPKFLDENTFLITEISSDPLYGLTSEKPIEVGGKENGPTNERRFLNALTGTNGEAISYYRSGSCCMTKSENAIFGEYVLLDKYRLTWQGSNDTISVYINMYDSGELMAPMGFGYKKK